MLRVLKLRPTKARRNQLGGGPQMGIGLRPLGDRVVIRPLAREEVTKSGIVLPDTAKEKPQQGEVVAVGPGRILDSGERGKEGVHDRDKGAFAKDSRTEIHPAAEGRLYLHQ